MNRDAMLPLADTALLQAEGLGLVLGGRRVVDQVSLALAPGQWAALVGPNGAGKSSLLSLLAGLKLPDAGRVLLDGRPLAEWPARARGQRLAWLSQQGEADGELAGADVVGLGRLPHQGLLVTSADLVDVDVDHAAHDVAVQGVVTGGQRTNRRNRWPGRRLQRNGRRRTGHHDGR